jgi:hypothetical protein
VTAPVSESRRDTSSLRASSAVVALGQALLEDVDVLADRLVEAILRDNPSYSAPGLPSPADVRASCRDNLRRVLQVLTGTGEPHGDLFDAPHGTGRARAEQGVPLESVLHAYRLGFRTIWEGLVEQARTQGGSVEELVGAATEVWEVVHRFSSEVADAYRATESEIVRRDDRHRHALIDALLDGRGMQRSLAADAAAALDLPEHGRFAVVVLDGTEGSGTAAAALEGQGLRSAWRGRAGREVGLVLVGSGTPAEVTAALAAVPGARAGVSPAVEGLADVAVAARLAETALRALPPSEAGVAELDARLPGALLVTAPDLAARLVARALGGVLALEGDERDVLLETLRVWLDTGGSAGQTAARLYCHRNTVLNRLRRLEALTGRCLERVEDVVEWSLALLALDVLPEQALTA